MALLGGGGENAGGVGGKGAVDGVNGGPVGNDGGVGGGGGVPDGFQKGRWVVIA